VVDALHRSSWRNVAGWLGFVLLLAGCSSDGRLAAIERRLDRLESGPRASAVIATELQPPARRENARIEDGFDEGWRMVGSGADYYGATRDAAIRRDGRSPILLAPARDTYGKHAAWMTSVDAAPYRGKRIRVAMSIKTNDAAQTDSFWARTQASDSPSETVALAARSLLLPDSSGWERRAIVVDVDPQADRIQYGIDLTRGNGWSFRWTSEQVWVDDPKLEVVDTDVAVTPEYDGETQVGDWLMTGRGARAFTASPNPEENAAVRIEPSGAQASEIHLVRFASAEGLSGRNVHVSFDVRTARAEGEAFCVLLIQRSRDMRDAWYRPLDSKELARTSTGYTHCDLAARVPDKSKWVVYGIRLEGAGTISVKGGMVTTSVAPPAKSF